VSQFLKIIVLIRGHATRMMYLPDEQMATLMRYVTEADTNAEAADLRHYLKSQATGLSRQERERAAADWTARHGKPVTELIVGSWQTSIPVCQSEEPFEHP
jgi:hypothetical protein